MNIAILLVIDVTVSLIIFFIVRYILFRALWLFCLIGMIATGLIIYLAVSTISFPYIRIEAACLLPFGVVGFIVYGFLFYFSVSEKINLNK